MTNYAELEKAELFISRQSTDEKVAYVISFIDELNITTSSSGALSDGPLRLTEKNNNVPTEKIWNDWKAYVVNARALYDTLDDQQKAQDYKYSFSGESRRLYLPAESRCAQGNA